MLNQRMVWVFFVCSLVGMNVPSSAYAGFNDNLTASRLHMNGRLYFVQHVGQYVFMDSLGIRCYYKGLGIEVGFAKGYVYYFSERVISGSGDAGIGKDSVSSVLFSLQLGDGNSNPELLGRLPSYSNYFLGSDSTSWYSRVGHYSRVYYRDVYPGIDLVYFFNDNGQLTYEYIVSAGVDPGQIELKFHGVDGIFASVTGVEVVTALGSLIASNLECYQEIGGERRIVGSRFEQRSESSYGISLLGDYDDSAPLVIDPTLEFSSYWGEGGTNNRTVVIDVAGNIYMSGGSTSTDWPTTPGAFDRTHGGNGWPDVTVAKFSADGSIVWSTLIGGSFEDYGYVSAVNEDGELYVGGRAGDGFPTTTGAFDRTFNGGIFQGSVHSPTDGFVVKLSAGGDSLLYSTYIGGSGQENVRAIHLLSTGEVLVGGGNTDANDLPTTSGVLKPSKGGARDSWVAKVSVDGGSLVFCTYFGPNNDTKSSDETIRALGLDLAGNIWLGGTTDGDDLVATADAFQMLPGGGRSDGYIAKISPDGKALLYFSWLGGSGFDEIETEGVSDADGNFYVCGSTASTDFPLTSGAFQSALRGGGGTFDGDGWVARINNDGLLGFATLYGGTTQGNEGFFGPVVDSAGNVYCTGRFLSNDCPVTSDAFQSSNAGPSGEQDAVLAVFSPDGKNLLYGSYFGGQGKDHGRHIAIHPDGSSVYIIGETTSTDLPLVSPSQTSPAGAFLVKFMNDLLTTVQLEVFSARLEQTDVVLRWRLASENNHVGFEVQRRSSNSNFNKIGFVSRKDQSSLEYSFTDRNPKTGRYYYRLKQLYSNGSFDFSGTTAVTVEIPEDFVLFQNHPNPFNASTTIKYSVAKYSHVKLVIMNLQGQEIETLADTMQSPGNYRVNWDASRFSSGLYLYKLEAGDYSQFRKMLLVK